MGLDLSLRNGLSAEEMSRELRSYLKYPDKLFRRVRDEYGKLHLSRAAKSFNPEAGAYRSSYKNAINECRLQNERFPSLEQLDFVVGVEIHVSRNHPASDICDELAGRYPKDFKFTGWHPNCRCHVETVLKTQEEINADTRKILRGEEPDGESVNAVKDVPQAFKDWIEENTNRIDDSRTKGTLPYFIKDNESKQWFNSVMAS